MCAADAEIEDQCPEDMRNANDGGFPGRVPNGVKDRVGLVNYG
tara:strand:- start:369 stop:497 length:129 start_codon:yes stop_codon:yes gene_type:complete